MLPEEQEIPKKLESTNCGPKSESQKDILKKKDHPLWEIKTKEMNQESPLPHAPVWRKEKAKGTR